MGAITTEVLTPEIRNEIVRDLVTHMYGYMEKPTSDFCKFVAQRLIHHYPFMKDSKGTGHVCDTTISYYLCITLKLLILGLLGKEDG